MIVCLIVVWLIVWKWLEIENFLKVEWEGIKGLSQNFSSCILISLSSKFISLQNPRVKIIWLLPFKEMKRGSKMIWISIWNILNLETLSNSMSSWGKIKWLLHIWRKRVGSFKEINWKSLWSYLKLIFHLKLFEIPNSNPIGSYLSFYSKYFSPKNK